MNKVIFCEGEEKSIDALFLNKYIVTVGTIKPIGTKNNITGFLKGYATAVKTTNYVLLRDRDFDFQPDETKQQLIKVDEHKNIFATYRASIESYFIDAQLLHKYLTWLRNTPDYKTKQAIDIPTVADIQTTIINSAKKIQYYQAVRWALARLKAENKFFFEIKLVKEDGKMPKQFDLTYCKTQANKLIDDFQRKTEKLSKDDLNTYIEEFVQKFSSDNFYTQEQYLVWFHGKDLQMLIQLELLRNYSNLSDLHFSMEKFMIDVCSNLNESEYFSQFEDFNELKHKLKT